MADVRTLQVFAPAQWDSLISALEHVEPLFQERLGFTLLDTDMTPGPVVADIVVRTFPEDQPLKVGDVVKAINARTVKNSAEVRSALQSALDTARIEITVARPNGSVTIPVKMVESPLEIRLEKQNILFNRQLLAFERAAPGTTLLQKNFARLNVGLCHMHFGEYQDALANLRQVQLQDTRGLGPGTVLYHMAQCYHKLGYLPEARDVLKQASGYRENTIHADDGPPLTREIERALNCLQ